MGDLPFEDRSDFENADRGLIASLQPAVVKDAAGPQLLKMLADKSVDGIA